PEAAKPAPTPPPAATPDPTPPVPRIVHKAPARHRVVRAHAASPVDDAEPASAPTSTQTVKEGRIVDPFAGVK
ncbi:MAG: hypothetical protein JWN44_5429, partial [Myxococcales bacterium]|nr:hypothetical protein [Myxococcales bacterium]